MLTTATFDTLWHMHDDFKFLEPAPEDDSCVYAKRYRVWAEQACRPVLADPHITEIHEAMLLNLLKYFEFRNAVPREHRNLTSDRGHTCIWNIFETIFCRLQVELLSLPQHTTLLLPKPPSLPLLSEPDPEPRLQGIYLGDDLGRAFE